MYERKNKKHEGENKKNLKNNNQNPDDSLKPINEENEEEPKIYNISKKGKSLGRKDFIKSALPLAVWLL